LPDEVGRSRVLSAAHRVGQREWASPRDFVEVAQPAKAGCNDGHGQRGAKNQPTERRVFRAEERPVSQNNRDGKAEQKALKRAGESKDHDAESE